MQHILFLCAGNRCQSVMAEAYVNHVFAGRWRAYSAGKPPISDPHPLAVQTLMDAGVLFGLPQSQSWFEFDGPGAPHLDFVISLSVSLLSVSKVEQDSPIWQGHPQILHWPFPDPAHFSGSEEDQRDHFRSVFVMIKERIDQFISP